MFIDLEDLQFDIFDSDASENREVIVEELSNNDVAIIGISCKFASTDNLDEYWELLKNGENGVCELPKERKVDVDKYFEYVGIKNKNQELKYDKLSYMKEIDKFDNGFFGINLNEAQLMDPNQRIFLQIAWQALEDAGYAGNKIKGTKTGIYMAVCNSIVEQYSKYIEHADPSFIGSIVLGNLKSVMASRLSYILDLKGPALAIDTACSSALTAIHQACQGIRNGDCEMALVGGTNIAILPGIQSIERVKIGIESSDCLTKTFDDSSDGTNTGEGCAAILLKSLDAAIRDKDQIYAVVKGSAINQDGSSIGITAPNAKAQENVILDAWKNSNISPETISYIEAHGTGTKLGDPIEIKAITNAFNKYTDKKQFCAIGSAKTNIGHTDGIAGLAGIIKAIMAIKNRKIPPNINFKVPNRNIDFKNSPVYVNDRLSDWTNDGELLRCGVSSFGMSGTNGHLILEEPKKFSEDIKENSDLDIITFSAMSLASLNGLIAEYRDFLNRKEQISFSDICYTVKTGRKHCKYRVALIVRDEEDLRNKIADLSNKTLEKYMFTESSEEDKAKFAKRVDYSINRFLESSRKDVDALKELCELYEKGVDIDWEKFYRDGSRRKVSLPKYHFDRNRCWFNLPRNRSVEHKFIEVYEFIKKENLPDNIVEQLDKAMEGYKGYVSSLDKNYGDKPRIKLIGRQDNNYTEKEKDIADAWFELTGYNEVNIFDDLLAMGIDSLQASIFVGKLRGKFDVSLADVYKYNTINSLAINIRCINANLKEKLDNIKEVLKCSPTAGSIIEDKELKVKVLDYKEKNKIYENINLNKKDKYENILLTGVTGYLGVHILSRLMNSTESNVYAIVRSSNSIDSGKRLEEKIKYYFDEDFYYRFKKRIFIVDGDLAHENFGLGEDEYKELSEKVDCIIHSAANANHFGRYQEFHEANVLATERILSFAKNIKFKDVNYISSLAVGQGLMNSNKAEMFSEYEEDISDEKIQGYYGKTKLIAEKAVIRARREGINANIFRIANITCNSANGKFQENINNNAFYLILKSFIRMEKVPDIDIPFDCSFVDYVSLAIVLLFNRAELKNQIYHIRNPYLGNIPNVIANDKYNLNVSKVSIDEFFDYLYLHNDDANMVEYVQNLMIHLFGDLNAEILESHANRIHIEQGKTNMILSMLGFQWPKIKEYNFSDMFDYCRRVKFI
ncbi:beta-ketoacyl synthase N-terminal-like domain-containing protein [Clostridium zeae]|nr:beta-ketoacyl synthase N-terminal-like domain-containing protein [Clostridium zeae]